MHLHRSMILGKNIFKCKHCFPTIKKFVHCLVSIETRGNSLLPLTEKWVSLDFFLSFFFNLGLSYFFLHLHLWKQKITKLKPVHEICLRKAAWFISSKNFIFARLLIILWLLQIVLLPTGKRQRTFNWPNDFPVHQTHTQKGNVNSLLKSKWVFTGCGAEVGKQRPVDQIWPTACFCK